MLSCTADDDRLAGKLWLVELPVAFSVLSTDLSGLERVEAAKDLELRLLALVLLLSLLPFVKGWLGMLLGESSLCGILFSCARGFC